MSIFTQSSESIRVGTNEPLALSSHGLFAVYSVILCGSLQFKDTVQISHFSFIVVPNASQLFYVVVNQKQTDYPIF